MFSPIAVHEHGLAHGEEDGESPGKDRAPQLLQLKPMNCPFHCLIYKGGSVGINHNNHGIIRSYREFPIKYAELGTVYRYERSGALHGLFRVRGFTQDDAHIFCLPGQITTEIIDILNSRLKSYPSLTFTLLKSCYQRAQKDQITVLAVMNYGM